MKFLLKFFMSILLAMPMLSVAQEVRVLSEGIDFVGGIGSVHRKTILLQNESIQAKTYILKSLRGGIGSSQKVKLCIGDQCFDPKRDLAKINLKLAPGEIFTDLYLEFDMGITETRGNFDLLFVNVENLRDNFVVEAKYEVKSESGEEFSHKDIKISDVYPNPSSRVAQIDYEVVNPKSKVKIAINSFIGNPIAEYELDPTRSSLVINVTDFQPGVYFYTLFVDNKNVMTKKLQVKK